MLKKMLSKFNSRKINLHRIAYSLMSLSCLGSASAVFAGDVSAIGTQSSSTTNPGYHFEFGLGGLSITSADGERSFNIHGQIVLNHSIFDGAYNVDADGHGRYGQNTEFESGRLDFSGRVTTDWGYDIQLANRSIFPDDDNDDVYFRYANVTYYGWSFAKVTLGKQGPDYGLDYMHDSINCYGTTFSMLSQAISLPNAIGISLHRFLPEQSISMSGGVYHTGQVDQETPSNRQGSYSYQNESRMVNARVSWSPIHNVDQGHVLMFETSFGHLGANGSLASPISVNGGVLGTLEANSNPPVTSGPYASGVTHASATIYDVGSAAIYGPFSLEMEYAELHNILNKAPDDPLYEDGLIQGGWVVTGEHRNYNAASGYVLGVDPVSRYGALELIGRLEYLDLESHAGQKGQKIGTIGRTSTVGVNWYLNKCMVFSVDGTYLDVSGPQAPQGHGYGGGIQFKYLF